MVVFVGLVTKHCILRRRFIKTKVARHKLLPSKKTNSSKKLLIYHFGSTEKEGKTYVLQVLRVYANVRKIEEKKLEK